MLFKAGKKSVWRLLALVMAVSMMMCMPAQATTLSVLDGKVSVSDTGNTLKNSSGTLTATAKGGLMSKKTNEITIENTSGSQAEISFDYSVASANAFKINDATASTSGSYSTILAPGGTIKLWIQSKNGFSGTTVTLTMSNIACKAAADSSSVTIRYDNALGSVTAGGASAADGTVKEGITPATGLLLKATANSGATFLGWVNTADMSVVSGTAEFTLKPSEDMTVKAVFVGAGSAPHFCVGSAVTKSASQGLLGMEKVNFYTVVPNYIFNDLNAATATAGADASNKVIVLLNDGTLPGGDYTIPAGVTLLIPFDTTNKMYTTQAECSDTYETPKAFRTLTMSSGAKITVNGAISISGQHRYAQGAAAKNKYGGAPTGKLGFVAMKENSEILVNNGGALYAYGYITGTGNVTVQSGGTVYENFQITDFRGGDQSTGMENRVFPVSQYYVQNIEVPLKLYSGAKEYGYTTINAVSSQFGSATAFISDSKSEAMFKLKNGYVVKKYDGETDRLRVEIHGDVSLSPISLKLNSYPISSEDYVLGINNNISIEIKSGNVVIDQDMAMLPGSELIVDQNTSIALAKGRSVYIYSKDTWQNNFCHGPRGISPVPYAPSKKITRTMDSLTDASVKVNGTVDASQGYMYTTTSGANIYSTGTGVVKTNKGTDTVTYQCIDNSGYVEIPITPAKLKNSDGTYTETATAVGSATYKYTDGVWLCQHNVVTDAAVPPTCTETGLTEGSHCSVCGAVLVAQQTVHANGHTAGAAADCENAQTCTVCGAQLQAALGHSWSGATCTAPKTCSVCGATEGTALGHDFSSATGECSRCDESREALVLVENVAEGTYCSITDAVKVSEEANDVTIRLFVNYEIAEPFDLGGREFEVSNNAQITIVEGGSVYDSHTDGYDATKAGSITLVSTPDGVYTYDAKHHYAAIDNGNGNYSFHRIGVSLTAARLDIYQRDIYLSVEATIRGTDAGLDALSAIGFDFGNSITAKLSKNAGEGEPKLDTDTREEKKNETTGVISYQIYGSYTMQLTKESPETYTTLAQLFYGNTPAKSVPRTIGWMDALNGIAADNTAVANALAKLAEGGA